MSATFSPSPDTAPENTRPPKVRTKASASRSIFDPTIVRAASVAPALISDSTRWNIRFPGGTPSGRSFNAAAYASAALRKSPASPALPARNHASASSTTNSARAWTAASVSVCAGPGASAARAWPT